MNATDVDAVVAKRVATEIDTERRQLARGRRQVRTMLSSYTGGGKDLEWFSAIVMVGWAVLLWLPGDMLDHPSFSPMRNFGMTEAVWAFVFFFTGSIRLVVLRLNGSYPRGPMFRMGGCLIGCVIWFPVAVMISQGSLAAYHVLSPGTIVYSLLGGAEILSMRRAAHDVRYYGAR